MANEISHLIDYVFGHATNPSAACLIIITSLPNLAHKTANKATTKTTTTTIGHTITNNTSYPLTCPKTWEKGPKRLKTLRNDQFHNFEHSSLPTSLIKQIKKKTIGQATACDTLMNLCSSISSHASTCLKTYKNT